ncbi:hypothetical protein QBC34DRAFT_475985 [Podospora aff. communis PSN243]|uniref:ABA 3 protein n=1 Tax=Podospora aff. communis PSN243 TaxID=3040156 RepID=A0AAV9G7A5_9PEZI|nr:hypothetical protein QBC34DRAFT_475985 [Podospora aff. communis PSN243]
MTPEEIQLQVPGQAMKNAVVSIQEIPIFDGAPRPFDIPAVVELVEVPATAGVASEAAVEIRTAVPTNASAPVTPEAAPAEQVSDDPEATGPTANPTFAPMTITAEAAGEIHHKVPGEVSPPAAFKLGTAAATADIPPPSSTETVPDLPAPTIMKGPQKPVSATATASVQADTPALISERQSTALDDPSNSATTMAIPENFVSAATDAAPGTALAAQGLPVHPESDTPTPIAAAKPTAALAPVPTESKPPKIISGSAAVAGEKDTWLYHKFFENDLLNVPGLTPSAREEVLTTAWEYSRVIIPHYTNFTRFACWVRFMIICIIAEYEGDVVDIAQGDKVLGYDLGELLDTMLQDRPGAEDMKREFRAFMLMGAEKCCDRRGGTLFRRYVNHLARGPKVWFRARECDALARFSIAAALCCNDIDDLWFNEEQLQVLGEIGVTLYDAVAFFKHRGEGETNNTFAYVDPAVRGETYKRTREVLWALDAAWGGSLKKIVVLNFIRPFGGPVHMMMRRYRYVEDGMIIGKLEDEEVVEQTRQKYKLWHRVDHRDDYDPNEERYQHVLANKHTLLYSGLAEELENDVRHCDKCIYQDTYGATYINEFGGVKLCRECTNAYVKYSESLPERAAAAFPELLTDSQLKVKT